MIAIIGRHHYLVTTFIITLLPININYLLMITIAIYEYRLNCAYVFGTRFRARRRKRRVLFITGI